MSAAEYSFHGRVGVITLNNPPVNGLGHALRINLLAGLERAAADAGIEAVVLTGAGNAFSGGADIREFDTPKIRMSPTVQEIICRIEAFTKPVIAAIHKVAMGGGLELALGCHFRVAVRGARIALPEVTLGLLPGAGGTQRLPRAIGPRAALEMIVGGKPVETENAAQMGLLDCVIVGELLAGAIAFAGEVVGERRPLKRLRDVTPKMDDAAAFFAEARSRMAKQSRGQPAPMKCLECVEAALTLPFDEGLALEHRCAEELERTVESRALRHAFFGERAVTRIPDIPEGTEAREIRKAAVIGAGAIGGGIAKAFANAGIPVTLLEIDQDYAGIADADFVIESVSGDLDAKQSVFETLDRVMKGNAILATNTSTLEVSRIAALTRRPQDVIGTHFAFPADATRLIEIVRGAKTSNEAVATAMRLARSLRKVGVVSGACDGFIGSRMLEPYMQQALFMLEEGAPAQDIDRALQEWGMAVGPFALSDLAGAGGYLRDVAGQPRVAHSKIGAQEIVERCIFALVNEAARILEEGVALRTIDIDMIFLTGYGFPSYRGGPLFHADTIGLENVVAAMKNFRKGHHGECWEVVPLLARLASDKKTFH